MYKLATGSGDLLGDKLLYDKQYKYSTRDVDTLVLCGIPSLDVLERIRHRQTSFNSDIILQRSSLSTVDGHEEANMFGYVASQPPLPNVQNLRIIGDSQAHKDLPHVWTGRGTALLDESWVRINGLHILLPRPENVQLVWLGRYYSGSWEDLEEHCETLLELDSESPDCDILMALSEAWY